MGTGRDVTGDAASAAMERYAAGDDAAFADLYDLLEPRLYGYLLRRVRVVEHAEDLLQQTLLHVHRARSSFIPGADVMPWVFAIARRLVIDDARKVQHERLVTDDVDSLEVVSRDDHAEDVAQAHELAVQIESALTQLPEPQRLAFDCLKRRGLSLSETASVLRISVGAVKLRLFRAQEALREALDLIEQRRRTGS